MIKSNSQNSNNQLSDIIRGYLNRGFGSMNKNDFEVWIFNYLLQNNLNAKTNFDISVELGIPESKVKRLRYEASLKYGKPKNTDQYNEAFLSLLENVNLKKGSGDIIQFAVEDLQLRKYLDSVLKKKGHFSDTSFNTEVVSITLEDLAVLLDATCSQQDKEKILKKAKNKGDFVEIVKSALITIIKMTGKATLSQGVNIGIAALIDALK